MSSILGQLSVALGGLVFIIALLMALSNGVPLLPAILRAFAVMCVTSMICALFFRYFTSVLYRFVADRLREQKAATPPPEEQNKQKSPPHSPAS